MGKLKRYFMTPTIMIEPRYAETDQMGIIHHSIYAQYYEMGRIAFCKAINLPFDMLEAKGLRLAIIELKGRFMKPALFGQVYHLETHLVEMSKVKMTFRYDLIDKTKTIIHQGETVLAWLNEDLRPINLFKQQPEIYQIFIDALRKDS